MGRPIFQLSVYIHTYYNECMYVCMYVCKYICMCTYYNECVCVFVGSCLATKVFIGNLPAMGRGWVIK